MQITDPDTAGDGNRVADTNGLDGGNAVANDNPLEISVEVRSSTNRKEDIDMVRAMGFNVDDDNALAPQNIPTLFNKEDVDNKATKSDNSESDAQPS